MSKAEERALEVYPEDIEEFVDVNGAKSVVDNNSWQRTIFLEGYHQAEEDLIDKTLAFLKKRLYKDGYVGVIDLCDDYIKAMKDDTGKR